MLPMAVLGAARANAGVGLKRFVWGLTLRVQKWAPGLQGVLKDLEHRNACVSLAGNNLELAGNGKPELQATAIRSRLSGKSRRTSRHDMSVMHVLA